MSKALEKRLVKPAIPTLLRAVAVRGAGGFSRGSRRSHVWDIALGAAKVKANSMISQRDGG